MLRPPNRDADGFEDAYRSVFPRACQVARRILDDSAAAEDAASEAFARALASWRRVSGLAYRDAWLLRVTANVAIDMARRRERARRITPAPGAGEDADVSDRVATRLALAAALAALPRRQREVVVLRYLADLTEPEVAKSLGVALGTVQQHTHRAITKLRGTLDPSLIEKASLVAD